MFGWTIRLPASVATAVLLLALLPVRAVADRADELAAIHIEAIGGRERINSLQALRATGEVLAGGRRMRFTMIAARPNAIRLETDEGNRSLVQATDGRNPPWQLDTGQWPPRYRDMSATAARRFTEDAEFDDPIVAGAARGFTLEYAGEVDVDGRKQLRLLVTHRLTETFTLLLDNETYLITQRIEDRKSPLGGSTRVVTVFEDYRPVNNVLVPHRVTLFVDGKPQQQTLIQTTQANPERTSDTFSRPVAVSVPHTDE